MEGAQVRASHTTPEGDVEEDFVIDLRDPISVDRAIRIGKAMRERAELEHGELAGRDMDIVLLSTE